MEKANEMINSAKINHSYQFMQVIMDFDDALEIFREAFQNSIDSEADTVLCKVYTQSAFGKDDLIIDIIDNGCGLERKNVDKFFNIADSTKIDDKMVRVSDKIGYKGHGAKIFLNSEKVIIASKSILDDTHDIWAVTCNNPIRQLHDTKELKYSGVLSLSDVDIKFPDEFCDSGFFLRIVNPERFKSINNRYKLNHLSIRDYTIWRTVFGTIRNNKAYNIKLYLHGLGFGDFRREYEYKQNVEPKLEFTSFGYDVMEVINYGHYFPDECSDAKSLKDAATKACCGKSQMDYYSHRLSTPKNPIVCENDVNFSLVMNLEGYETKRKYNLCLVPRGKSIKDKIHYADETVYGLWACKDGIPIEKIDDWIKGKGSYTYIHGFLDCDKFELNGIRSSIKNTPAEIIDTIKIKLNEILDSPEVSKELKQREKEEKKEKGYLKAQDDRQNLRKRYLKATSRKKAVMPDGTVLSIPTKLSNGRDYSESETMILLVQLIDKYPDLFDFDLLDYDTSDGIDFVVYHKNEPKYIELKGSLKCNINHSFDVVSKFICYTISKEVEDKCLVSDIEDNVANFLVYKNDKFHSRNHLYDGKPYTGYKIDPATAHQDSMQVIALDKVITEILGGTIS